MRYKVKMRREAGEKIIMAENFEFTYSAARQEEVEAIRKKYLPKTEDKMEALRKLDKKVKNIPTTISLILGIVGILLFGLGLSMVLEWKIVVWGIIVSIFGFIPTLLAFPIYQITLNSMKAKYSPQIIKLSEELLNEQDTNKQ